MVEYAVCRVLQYSTPSSGIEFYCYASYVHPCVQPGTRARDRYSVQLLVQLYFLRFSNLPEDGDEDPTSPIHHVPRTAPHAPHAIPHISRLAIGGPPTL